MQTPASPLRAFFRDRSLASLLVVVALGALAGCGDKNKDKAASQTAAKVNKEEITVHQINYILSQQRALPPEQAASSGRQVLERLIDQEVVLQKASEQKLDRDPRVVQQIEAARRDIIARAYLDKLGQGAPKATPPEVVAYYKSHPDLFSERRVYNLQEVSVEASPEQVATLKAKLAQGSFADFVAYLKDNGFKYAGTDAVRTAEQLPMADLGRFAAMKDDQSQATERPRGMQIIHLVRSRVQPVSEEQARPAIEQFLLNERKRKLIADDLVALRGAAKIEYVGQFEADAARAPYVPPSSPELKPVTSLAPTLPASSVNAAPQVDIARPDSAPASMPSGETLDKGLKGMK